MRSSEILINSWHNNKFWCSYRSSSLQPFKPSSHQAVKNLGDRTSPHGFMITDWWCNNHPEDMKVNGKDDIPYMKWKIKFMFETTNQMIYAFVLALLYLWEESLAAQCWTCPQYSICPLAWDVGGKSDHTSHMRYAIANTSDLFQNVALQNPICIYFSIMRPIIEYVYIKWCWHAIIYKIM